MKTVKCRYLLEEMVFSCDFSRKAYDVCITHVIKTMSQKTYTGSCHCGAVKYHVDLDLEKPVITCNCSMCQRAGTMLAFVPASEFTLEQGEESLTDYLFNEKKIHHLFCKVCGTKPFARGQMADGSPTVAVNVRCLEGVDVSKLPTHHYDGKSV